MTISRLMRLLNCLLIYWASSLLMDGSHSEELSPNLLFLGSLTTLAFHQSSEEWFDWFLFPCICSKGCNSRQIKDLKHQFCTGVGVTSLPFKLGIEKPSRNGWKCLIPYLFISRMDSIINAICFLHFFLCNNYMNNFTFNFYNMNKITEEMQKIFQDEHVVLRMSPLLHLSIRN